jgi:uncharacterized protein YndB with AHSA1/START domain
MNNTGSDEILIERVINAPPEAVWKAWTDPTLVLKWFGSDPNGRGLKANVDVQPGGSFEITFRDADETEHTCNGVYADVQPFSKLAFSWMWKSEPGVESFVTVILRPENNSTRMLFSHAHLGTASKHDYLNGWQATFLKLERMLRLGTKA